MFKEKTKRTHFRVWKSGKKWLYGASVFLIAGMPLLSSSAPLIGMIRASAGTLTENGASLTVPDDKTTPKAPLSLFVGESLTASQFGVSAFGSGTSGAPAITGINPNSVGSQTAAASLSYAYQVPVPPVNLKNPWPIVKEQVQTSLPFDSHFANNPADASDAYYDAGTPWNNGVGGNTSGGYYLLMDEANHTNGAFDAWLTSPTQTLFNADTLGVTVGNDVKPNSYTPIVGWLGGNDFLGHGSFGNYDFSAQTPINPQMSYHAVLNPSATPFSGFVIPFEIATWGLGDLPGIAISDVQNAVNQQVDTDVAAGKTPTAAELTTFVHDDILKHWVAAQGTMVSGGQTVSGDGQIYGLSVEAAPFDHTTSQIVKSLSPIQKVSSPGSADPSLLEGYTGAVFVTYTPASTKTVSGTLKSEFPVNYFARPTLSAAPNVTLFASDSLAAKDLSASVVDSLSAVDRGTLTSSLVSSSLGVPASSSVSNSSSADSSSSASSGTASNSIGGSSSASSSAGGSTITLPTGSSAAVINSDGSELKYHSASNGAGEAHISVPINQATAPGTYVIGYDYNYTDPELGTKEHVHAEQTVTVYPDPSLTAPADQKLQVGDLYTQSSASVSDVASSFDKGSLTSDDSKVSTSAAGTYPVNFSYSYFDPYTNSTKTVTVQQHVEVDAKAPAKALPDTGEQPGSNVIFDGGIAMILAGLVAWQRERISRWLARLKKNTK